MSLHDGDGFWDRWVDWVVNNTNSLIQPDDKMVVQVANHIPTYPEDKTLDIAHRTWEEVRRRVNYELTDEWRTPRETLMKGYGGCEDMTFLQSSLLINLGVDRHHIAVGILEVSDGKLEEHTWNMVNDEIIDPTGSPKDVESLNYTPKRLIEVTREQTERKEVNNAKR